MGDPGPLVMDLRQRLAGLVPASVHSRTGGSGLVLSQRQKTRRVHEQELVASITYQMSVLFLLTPYLKPQFRLLNQSGTNQDWLSSCNNWDLRWETRV